MFKRYAKYMLKKSLMLFTLLSLALSLAHTPIKAVAAAPPIRDSFSEIYPVIPLSENPSLVEIPVTPTTTTALDPAPADTGWSLYLPAAFRGLGQPPVETLRPRAIFPKPEVTLVDPDRVSAGQIVLKFHEGTHIRRQDGRFTFDPSILTAEEQRRMGRLGLSEGQVFTDVDNINAGLSQDATLLVDRLFFGQDEQQLAEFKAEGENLSGEELADLDLYYFLLFDQPDVARAADLTNWLNSLPSVEIAYPMPIPSPAEVDIPPATTIDPPLAQGYLDSAPGGINARYAWNYPGAKGANVRLIDVEVGWNLDHEDLPASFFFSSGWIFPDQNHGTAVFGELAAVENEYGATGIVPELGLGWSSVIFAGFPNFFYNVPAAINNAASALSFGDIILIEQHYPGPDGGNTCANNCNCGQFAYVAMENYQADFDAIRNATARNIIVIEAAGNGQMNLDGPQYEGRFNRSVRDSGAILVGAGGAGTRLPRCFTNFGSRLDLQGWGNGVETLGYGDIQINGGDERQWYTRSFGGTSSASPIVAGAVASIQGVRDALGMSRFSPFGMRLLLTTTGTPQATSASQIGPLPDLRGALHAFLPQVAEFDSQAVPVTLVANETRQVSVTMRNKGNNTWILGNGYNLGSQNQQDNFTWGLQRVPLPGNVSPGDLVTFTFNITAPASPGVYNFQWRMVQDGVEWFGDFTPNLAITVVPDNRASFVSQSVPSTMLAGHSYLVEMTYQNTGTAGWSPHSHYGLGSQNPQDNTIWGTSRVELPAYVAPGNQVTFQFWIVAPAQPGSYNFQWRMVQDRVGWFGDFSPNQVITVLPAANNAQFISQSVPTFMYYDNAYLVSITMKNVGTTTWTSGAGYRLGSQSPQDTMRWSINRVELPYSVAPGDTVTFTFEVVPAVGKGMHDFQWRMVQDGVEWFGELTEKVVVTVVVDID